MYNDHTTLCVGPGSTIQKSVEQMDANGIGIVLVVDPERHLLGTITDGDIRRAILAKISFDEPISKLLSRKSGSEFALPITAPENTGRDTLRSILQNKDIRHLPLVDSDGKVVDLVTLDEFVPDAKARLNAVIMAGGQGQRLRPLTDDLPKPMLQVGDRPLMEIIVDQMHAAGVTNLNVAVNHKHEKILEHFGDGANFGVNITYLKEDQPLGTAGSLGMMEPPTETVLVMNGDILTRVDFRAMLSYHRDQNADFTVAVQGYDLEVPYGVIECTDTMVESLSEKPVMKFLVNAGIYLLEPSVFSMIPKNTSYDMTTLIQSLLDNNRRVAAFPIREYWLDIGEYSSYVEAQEQSKIWDARP